MTNVPVDLLNNFAYTVIVAFILTWIFDIFEILIKEKNNKYIYLILNVKDMCCVIIFCLSLILILYYSNQGVFRGLYLAAILTGGFIYYSVFIEVLRGLSKIILMPIINLILAIIKIIRKIIIFSLVTIEKKYAKLYNKIKNCKS